MAGIDEKLIAMQEAVASMVALQEETLNRLQKVEKTVKKTEKASHSKGYKYPDKYNALDANMHQMSSQMTGSDDLFPNGLYEEKVPPLHLEKYGIKAWKDKALLGLAGEEDVEFYDITQFVDMNIYQAGMGNPGGSPPPTPGPREKKISSRKVTDDVAAGLANISPAIWMGANAKIMAKLMQEGKLVNEAIFSYLAYTLKISQLSASNTWQSILRYDRMFRIQQAISKCGWGEDFPHLGCAYLEKKPKKVDVSYGPPGGSHTSNWSSNRQKADSSAGNRRRRGQGERSTGDTGQSGTEDKCTLYNLHKCFFNPCRYRHVCEICEGDHAAIDNMCPPQARSGVGPQQKL